MKAFSLAAVPLAFVAIAGVTAAVVGLTTQSVARTSNLFNESGVPTAWTNSTDNASGIVSGVSAQVSEYEEAGRFVQYNSYVKNNSTTPRYVTHISSYLTSTDSGHNGFVPLSEATIEYTYTPDNQDSWQRLAISAPANNPDGFKLANSLYLSTMNEPMNTVYFRYNVSAKDTPADELSSQLAFLVSEDGKDQLSVASSTIAYGPDPSGAEESVIAAVDESPSTTDPLSEDLESATAKPLGVVSYLSNTDFIYGTINNASTPQSFPIMTQALLVLLISVFAAALILYIPMRRKQQR